MMEITRALAIEKICSARMETLTNEARGAFVLAWWREEKGEAELAHLSKELAAELAEEPPNDAAAARYDPMVLLALARSYVGVRSDFLASVLEELSGEQVGVIGEAEPLFTCSCCMFRTLVRPCQAEPCPLCLWQDDGYDDEAQYSGPNHMLLGEGRARFQKMKGLLPLNKWLPGEENP